MAEQEKGTREHLYRVIKEFHTGMLVTGGGAERIRSRPMALAEVETEGDLYFVTSESSPNVAELLAHPRVNVTFQGTARFASVSGEATLIHDPPRLDRLWSDAWKVWFPLGKQDPSLCLLRVRPEDGEYWDNAGARGLRYLWEATKAYVEGKTPPPNGDLNARVPLG